MALQLPNLARLLRPSFFEPIRLSTPASPPSFVAAALLTPWLPLPSLPSLWESILRAVPKKKTTHSRKRSRQLAGKALKDVHALNTCLACGRTKRMHTLCPHCVQTMKDLWAGRTSKPGDATAKKS